MLLPDQDTEGRQDAYDHLSIVFGSTTSNPSCTCHLPNNFSHCKCQVLLMVTRITQILPDVKAPQLKYEELKRHRYEVKQTYLHCLQVHVMSTSTHKIGGAVACSS